MGLVRTVNPVHEPIELEQAKSWLRIEDNTEDADVQATIASARDYAEQMTERSLMTQTWRLTMDRFPCWEIRLPRPPVQSVGSVQYVATDGTLTTLDADQYEVDLDSEPARITPAYGLTWPTARCQVNAVRVTYTAGYPNVGAIPPGILQAMRILTAARWEKRATADVMEAVDHLLTQHWVGSYTGAA